ncbi:MAG TPA: hypothetical protein VNR51_10195 [Hyphomicrobium sp.]|nr:hypothetical protein [Hyphomicrobium sp.]
MNLQGAELKEISEQAQVPLDWLNSVLSGNAAATIDLPALKRLAQALGATVAPFISKAVEYLLTQTS